MDPLFEDPRVVVALLAAAVVAMAVFFAVVQSPVRGIYLYVFGSAITLSPYLPVVREKLAGCDLVMLMVWATALLRSDVWSSRIARINRDQRRAILAGASYILACAISFFANLYAGAIEPWWVARGGVELFTYFYGFLAAIAVVVLIETWEEWINCLVAWGLGTLIVSSVSVMAATVYAPGWAVDSFTGRVSGTMRESAQVASYVGPIFPCLVFLVSASVAAPRFRWLLFVTIPAALIAMMASGSRTAFVILVMALSGLFALRILYVGRYRLNNMAFLMIVLGGLLGVGKFTFDVINDKSSRYVLGETSPFERAIRMLSEWGKGERVLDQTRANQIAGLTANFWKHPMIGPGPANYTVTYNIHETHNSYLAALSDTGVLGFATLMSWIGCTWLAAYRGLRRTRAPQYRLIVTAILFGFCLLLTYQLTVLGLRQRPWWFMAGLMIALSRVADSAHLQKMRTVHEVETDALQYEAPVDQTYQPA